MRNKRQAIINFINKHDKVQVEFIKADGELRKLVGTRNASIIQQHGYKYKNSSDKSRVKQDENNGIVRIFDVEKNGWRSFRVDRFKKIKVKR